MFRGPLGWTTSYAGSTRGGDIWYAKYLGGVHFLFDTTGRIVNQQKGSMETESACSLFVVGGLDWPGRDFDAIWTGCTRSKLDEEWEGGLTTGGGCSKSILEPPSPEREELGSCLPTNDVDCKVPSVNHRPTVVRRSF